MLEGRRGGRPTFIISQCVFLLVSFCFVLLLLKAETPPSKLFKLHSPQPKAQCLVAHGEAKGSRCLQCTSADAQLRLGPGRGYTGHYLEGRQKSASARVHLDTNHRFSRDNKALASSDPCVVRGSNQGVPCKRSKQCAPSVYFVIHELHHIRFFFSSTSKSSATSRCKQLTRCSVLLLSNTNTLRSNRLG